MWSRLKRRREEKLVSNLFVDIPFRGIGFFFAICLKEKDAMVHSFYKDRHETDVLCMRIGKDHTKIQIASLVAHEACHITDNFMDFIGEDIPGFEMKVYFLQFIVQLVLERIEDAGC